MSLIAALDKAIRTVCPIDGVSIGDIADKATWRIDFASNATSPQMAAAVTTMAAFVYDATADDTVDYKSQVDQIMTQPNNVIRGILLLIMSELNILRTHAAIGLAPRTETQLRTALKNLGN